MLTPGILITQMKEKATDQLPKQWRERADSLIEQSKRPGDPVYEEETSTGGITLQQWLEELYFDGSKTAELTREDVRKLGDLIGRMLRFEPSSRETASSLLKHAWFD